MVGWHDTYDDAAPGDIYSINTSLYYRRYFNSDKAKRWVFYLDAYMGAAWVYEVSGKYNVDYATGNRESVIDESPGDVLFVAGLQPGLRVRMCSNLHLFFGPSIATDCIGLHFGIGF